MTQYEEEVVFKCKYASRQNIFHFILFLFIFIFLPILLLLELAIG